MTIKMKKDHDIGHKNKDSYLQRDIMCVDKKKGEDQTDSLVVSSIQGPADPNRFPDCLAGTHRAEQSF